jgi:hypothetical protein
VDKIGDNPVDNVKLSCGYSGEEKGIKTPLNMGFLMKLGFIKSYTQLRVPKNPLSKPRNGVIPISTDISIVIGIYI